MTIFNSTIKNLSFYVVVNGVQMPVAFSHTSDAQKGGVFRTKDNALAEAVKKHELYGKWFTLESEEQAVEEEAVPASKSYENVTRTQEANKILVNEYGIDKDALRSKEDALACAEKLNIEFPNLK